MKRPAGTPMLCGNDVTYLVDGEATFGSILEGLAQAEHTALFRRISGTKRLFDRPERTLPSVRPMSTPSCQLEWVPWTAGGLQRTGLHPARGYGQNLANGPGNAVGVDAGFGLLVGP